MTNTCSFLLVPSEPQNARNVSHEAKKRRPKVTRPRGERRAINRPTNKGRGGSVASIRHACQRPHNSLAGKIQRRPFVTTGLWPLCGAGESGPPPPPPRLRPRPRPRLRPPLRSPRPHPFPHPCHRPSFCLLYLRLLPRPRPPCVRFTLALFLVLDLVLPFSLSLPRPRSHLKLPLASFAFVLAFVLFHTSRSHTRTHANSNGRVAGWEAGRQTCEGAARLRSFVSGVEASGGNEAGIVGGQR